MPTKIYQHDESAISWLSSGGTELLTCTSLGAAAGRQGALHDFGTAARARRYAFRFYFKPGGTRVVGQPIYLYWKTSDGTHADNDDGTGDIAVSAIDKIRNLSLIGIGQIDENAAVEMVISGVLDVEHRWGCPVVWNATANALSATAADFGFLLTPIPDEVQ